MKKHFDMLGCKGEDKVTGYKGVVTSLSFDLYGCIQVVLSPPVGSDGDKIAGHWFDINRIDIKSSEPVIEVPCFSDGSPVAKGKKGPAEKPMVEK